MDFLCPICKSPASAVFQTASTDVWQCGNSQCRHLFAASPRKAQGIMPENASAIRKTYETRNRKLISTWLKRGWLNPQGRILDFGAGTGHIADSLRELLPLARLTCIEPGETLAKSLFERGHRIFPDLETLPENELFDFIVLTEVIEHVPDPLGLLKGLQARLAPGGFLFLTTPCGEKRTGSRRTNAYECPFHIQFFTEKSLRKALENACFVDIAFHYLPQMYPPLPGWRGLRQKAKQTVKSLLIRVEGYSHLVCLARKAGENPEPS